MYVCLCVVADKDEASLAALDITDESHLFLWDGVQVGREHIPVGEGCEPMQLSITYPTGRGWGEEDEDEEDEEEDEEETEVEMAMSFSKSATLREVRVRLWDEIHGAMVLLRRGGGGSTESKV